MYIVHPDRLEAMTHVAQRWLASQPAGSMATSDWVVIEFSAALSMKLREKRIGTADRAQVLSTFTLLADESLEVWPVTRGDYRTACRFANQHATGLRAGDALHVAIAAERGASICTLDRAMIAAARTLGVNAAPPA